MGHAAWPARRRRALALLAGQAKRSFPTAPAGVLVRPPYLTEQQVAQVTDIFAKSGIGVIGSATAPLALAATCSAGFGTALVLDADDHVADLVRADG